MRVLLIHVDGKLPNHALMRLSTWHKENGHDVRVVQDPRIGIEWEPDHVYASSLFEFYKSRRDLVAKCFPNAVVGGDGYFPVWKMKERVTERNIGSNLREVIKDRDVDSIPLDYTLYPKFTGSIGYSQRGCRLNCGFCLMQTREGKARNVSTLARIWRGNPHPKHLHLLDNDFFGQPNWHDLLQEAIDGQFKVCFNQGINIRLIKEDQAEMLAKVHYADDAFKTRRLYTAWDNLGDEQIFKRGVRILQEAGIPPSHLMVYMVLGYRPGETEEEALYRYNELVNLGCKAYPMVFDRSRLLLCRFQKWVIRRYNEVCTWEEFKNHHKRRPAWDEHVEYHARIGQNDSCIYLQ